MGHKIQRRNLYFASFRLKIIDIIIIIIHTKIFLRFLLAQIPRLISSSLPAGDDKYGRRLRYLVQLRQWYRLLLEKGTANDKP